MRLLKILHVEDSEEDLELFVERVKPRVYPRNFAG